MTVSGGAGKAALAAVLASRHKCVGFGGPWAGRSKWAFCEAVQAVVTNGSCKVFYLDHSVGGAGGAGRHGASRLALPTLLVRVLGRLRTPGRFGLGLGCGGCRGFRGFRGLGVLGSGV